MSDFIFTSESVTEGHPDKICDQISDAVLDALLTEDPESRVACETVVNTGLCLLTGEITTKAKVDYIKVVRNVIKEIGYEGYKAGGFDANSCAILVALDEQSPDISQGVTEADDINNDLEGEYLPLKFLEVDEERNRLVLSHRRALVEKKMNRLEVGEVVVGSVKGIKPYGAFIDIGGVSGLLHISEISHEHIETPHNVLNVNDQMKVMIIDLDSERGRISLSTKALEPEPGDMLTDPQKVFSKAEEMAAKYKQMLFEQTDENEETPVASSETV